MIETTTIIKVLNAVNAVECSVIKVFNQVRSASHNTPPYLQVTACM